MIKGIDVSHWNGNPFNQATKKAYLDADFVIAKATQGTTFIDNCLNTNADKVLKDGKLLGLYHYAAGTNATKEADFFVKNIEKYIGKAVLALDWESGQNQAWGSTTWAKAFCDRVYEQTKISPIVYVQASAASQVQSCAGRYKLWLAGYPKQNWQSWTPPAFPYQQQVRAFGSPTIWQYTSAGGVDKNIGYITAGVWRELATPANQPSKTKKAAQKKSVNEIAQEVIAGKWGNGANRKARLLAAGYPASEIQARVNQLLETPSIIKVDAKVKLKPNALIYGTAQKFSNWVYDTQLTLYQLKGDRAVIAYNGKIVGAVKINHLDVI